MTTSNEEPTPIGGREEPELVEGELLSLPPAGQPYIKFGIPDVGYSTHYIPLTLDDPDADCEAMEAALENAVWFRGRFLEKFPLPEAPALPSDPPAGQQRPPDEQQRPQGQSAAQPPGGGGGNRQRGKYPIVAYCRECRTGVHFSVEKFQPVDADKCYHDRVTPGPDGKKTHTLWWRETFHVENGEWVSNAGVPMPASQIALAEKLHAAAEAKLARSGGGGGQPFTGGNPEYNDGGPDDLPF